MKKVIIATSALLVCASANAYAANQTSLATLRALKTDIKVSQKYI